MHTPSFLIVADRGRLLAYTLDRSATRAVPRLVDSVDFAEGQQQLREQVTDMAGSFPNGGTAGNSTAERMTLTAELEMRAFRKAVERITALLHEHRPERWGFAAPSEINGAILDGLDPKLRARLGENLPLDLTRTPSDRLLKHFERG